MHTFIHDNFIIAEGLFRFVDPPVGDGSISTVLWLLVTLPLLVLGLRFWCLELDEEFVPGAKLDEPLKAHTVEALRMWLICHAVAYAPSLKKAELIEK